MGYSIFDYASTEASDSATGGWNTAENQDPSTVNDGARQHKQNVANFLKDQGGVNTTGGSANAQTVTLNQAIATTVPTGFFFTVKFGYTNTSTTVTLNVNSIGAKSVKVFRSGALADPAVGDLQADNYGRFLYDGTQFVLLNPSLLSAANTWSAQQSFTNSALDVQIGQIKFPATQNASSNANTLDDYEEGTTTPTVTPNAGSFTTVSCTLKYTKVGNLVTVNGTVLVTSIGTAIGFWNVPLPFPCGSQTSVGVMRTTFDIGGTAIVTSGSASLTLGKYDGTGPGGSCFFNISYQV